MVRGMTMTLLNREAVEGGAVGGHAVVQFAKDRLWGGLTAAEAEKHLNQLVNQGHLHKCHYVVSMVLYAEDSPLRKVWPSFLHARSFDDDRLYWHLVTQTNLPIMQTDTDSVKAGSFAVNRITGQQSSEIQMTFLVDGTGLVLKAFQDAKKVKFLPNGLQRPPAQTAIRLRIALFGARKGRLVPENLYVAEEYLVEVQAVEPLSLAGNDGSPVEVQVTFMQLDPFMIPTPPVPLTE